MMRKINNLHELRLERELNKQQREMKFLEIQGEWNGFKTDMMNLLFFKGFQMVIGAFRSKKKE